MSWLFISLSFYNFSFWEKTIENNTSYKERVTRWIEKLSNIFEKSYTHIFDKYNSLFYYYGIKNIDQKMRAKYNLFDNLLWKIKKWLNNNNKKLLVSIIQKINNQVYIQMSKRINHKIINRKNSRDFEAKCAYDVIKKYWYENKYIRTKWGNKQKVKEELKNTLYSICGHKEIPAYKINNDKKLIMADMLNDFNNIKIFPSKNLSLNQQNKIKKDKLNISNNPLMIKFASLVWIRNLNWRKDYHCWIDMTLSALNYDMISNYQILSWKRKDKYVTAKMKDLWKLLYSKVYTNLMKDHWRWYHDYKKWNKLYINLTKKYLDKYNCYLWINRSRYSNKIVGFWNFLLCVNKDWANAIVLGHLSAENYIYLSKNKLLNKIDSAFERFKLGMITGKWYEWNYYWFNKKKLRWDNPNQEIYYWMPNSNNLFYKIDSSKLNNGIILKYWTTGHSYWDHIHMSNIILDGDIAHLVVDNNYLEKVVQRMFWSSKINFTNNHFFFLDTF